MGYSHSNNRPCIQFGRGTSGSQGRLRSHAVWLEGELLPARPLVAPGTTRFNKPRPPCCRSATDGYGDQPTSGLEKPALQCTRATTIHPSCRTRPILGNSAPKKQNSRGGASSIWMMDVPAGVGACSGNAETPNHLIRNGLAPDAAIRTAAGPDAGLAPLDRELARERQAMGDVEARAAELTNLGGDVEEL